MAGNGVVRSGIRAEEEGGDHRKLDQREVATRRRRDAAMATNTPRVVEPDNEKRVNKREEGGTTKMDRVGSLSRK